LELEILREFELLFFLCGLVLCCFMRLGLTVSRFALRGSSTTETLFSNFVALVATYCLDVELLDCEVPTVLISSVLVLPLAAKTALSTVFLYILPPTRGGDAFSDCC